MIEYVLILVVMVVVAAVMVRACVSRDPEDPGVVTDSWNKAARAIGNDKADDVE